MLGLKKKECRNHVFEEGVFVDGDAWPAEARVADQVWEDSCREVTHFGVLRQQKLAEARWNEAVRWNVQAN